MSKRKQRYVKFDAWLYDFLEMPEELCMMITDYVDPCEKRVFRYFERGGLQSCVVHNWEIYFDNLKEFRWRCRHCDVNIPIPAPLP